MVTEVPSETLSVTISKRDKRKLRIAAAVRGVSMRSVVRELIREMPDISATQGASLADE